MLSGLGSGYVTASYSVFLKEQNQVEASHDRLITYQYIYIYIVVKVVVVDIWIKNLMGAILAPLNIF